MRFAYADPPYPGCSHLYPEKTEVDYPALIARLIVEYPDGWALSTHSPSLRDLLPLCPHDTRVMVWAKTYANHKPNVGVTYAWEPVLVRGGRPRTRDQWSIFDWVSCAAAKTPGFRGAKPDKFCWWLFTVLNAEPGDELDDLFPGTGAVTRAWHMFLRQMTLPLVETP